MALSIGDNFSYLGAKPLDERIKYATVALMAAVADNTLYNGCIAYCEENGKTYQWKSSNSSDPTTGKWREFSGGGSGGASELAELDDVSLDSLSDGDVLKYDATNDEWVNGGEGQTIQVNTLPTAGADQVGKVYQYIGVTNVNYIHGYFYECTTDGTTYEWTQTDTQPGGSGHTIKDEGTALTQRNVMDFTDFDISDDSTNEETDVAPHRLTAAELAEIVTPLPAVPIKGINYSTEEQIIGKWIDGKPLYQKTIVITNIPNENMTQTSHGISNLGEICDIKGVIHAKTSVHPYTYTPIPRVLDRVSTDNIAVDILADSVQLKARGANLSETFDKAYVTFQYTKTTDVAP